MPELRDALREATNKIGVIAGSPQLIVFDAMLTSYPAITIAGPIGFGVNPANAFAGAAATIELIANGANVPTFTGIIASGSWANTANSVNRINFECLPSGAGSALAFYARISQPAGSPAGVTSVAGKTGAVTLDKGDVGLGAVNNTADADKPISNATAAALTDLSAAITQDLINLERRLSMIGTAYTNTSAANTAAVITVAAPGAGLSLQLNQLTFSYSAAPTSGLLTIQQGSLIIHETAITSAGAGPAIVGYKLAPNTPITITLMAGGSGVVGRVSASIAVV